MEKYIPGDLTGQFSGFIIIIIPKKGVISLYPISQEPPVERLPGYREQIILKSYFKSAIQTVENKLSIMNEEYFAEYGRKPIQMITSRVKKEQSIIDKMKRHGYELTMDNAVQRLYDIAGVRAICAFEHDVYHMAEVLLQHEDIHLHHRKDFIQTPKESGYRSLHLLISMPIYLAAGKRDVRMEVQLRTITMDFWASMEHELRYKQKIAFPEELNQEILECADLSAALDERMGKLQRNLTAYLAFQE